MALKTTPNIENFSANYNHNNLPVHCILSKVCSQPTNRQTNCLPKMGTLEKERREWLKICEPGTVDSTETKQKSHATVHTMGQLNCKAVAESDTNALIFYQFLY